MTGFDDQVESLEVKCVEFLGAVEPNFGDPIKNNQFNPIRQCSAPDVAFRLHASAGCLW
ncbi:hypothetical protein NMD1_02985 [Novosphingobium sp. MD-1]|nr:hypothetical protein NMD1_02985 [Novosphingobium sp. MD-1]